MARDRTRHPPRSRQDRPGKPLQPLTVDERHARIDVQPRARRTTVNFSAVVTYSFPWRRPARQALADLVRLVVDRQLVGHRRRGGVTGAQVGARADEKKLVSGARSPCVARYCIVVRGGVEALDRALVDVRARPCIDAPGHGRYGALCERVRALCERVRGRVAAVLERLTPVDDARRRRLAGERLERRGQRLTDVGGLADVGDGLLLEQTGERRIRREQDARLERFDPESAAGPCHA